MYCYKCGKEIDDNAEVCVFCGTEMSGVRKSVENNNVGKKFCSKCGGEVREDAVICIHCGCAIQDESQVESKTGMGVIAALFLGIIGLVIGICLYPENSVARKTFLKGWTITFIVSTAVSVISSILYLTIAF